MDSSSLPFSEAFAGGDDGALLDRSPGSDDETDEDSPPLAEARETVTDAHAEHQPAPALSKNAQKRLRKAEYLKTLKQARRKKDKEKKAEKKRKREEAIAAGEVVGSPARKRSKPTKQEKFAARIVVDLGFDDKMTEKEVQSLCNQLSYTYGANRRASFAFKDLMFTGLSGQTAARLKDDLKGAHERWKDVEWWGDGYERLWEHRSDAPAVGVEGTVSSASAAAPNSLTSSQTAAKESVVYLTADGDEELCELKEGETYIIGGLVDRNRYKNICKDKALEQGIRAARLPIGTYLSELTTRKVLTVNQVFDILLSWLEKRDWREAFWKQIPKRKFQGQDGLLDSMSDGERDVRAAQSEDAYAVEEEDQVDAQLGLPGDERDEPLVHPDHPGDP